MKILIADDESLIRQSIRMFLKDLGVDDDEVVEAANGLSMLEAVKDNHFDLALVDIRMPSMDGLMAIRHARESAPYTDFYVLSGFDDFKYAQESIRLGVKDYILKPLTRAQLGEILEQTIARMEKEKAKLLQNLTLCTMALFGRPEEMIPFPQTCYPLLITDDVPDAPFMASELLEKDTDKLMILPYTQPEGTLLFLFETPEYPGYASVYIKEVVQQYGGCHTILEGKAFSDSLSWKQEWERLTLLAACRFLFKGHKLYRNTLKPPELKPELSELCRHCENCLKASLAGDYASFSLSGQALVQTLEAVWDVNSSAAANLLAFLGEAYHIAGQLDRDNLPQKLKQVSVSMIQTMPKDFRGEEILQYIEKHYREDLSLTGISALFGFSPNYFSTLFKKKTGCNFVQYLTKLRIRESKRLLLETPMTIQEISAATGYYSASFFIRSFKKAEGMTPLDYRRTHLEGQG
ncbi:MAG: response regulator [Hungatella sp.]|nr:response regulator [Hungatella sp.]